MREETVSELEPTTSRPDEPKPQPPPEAVAAPTSTAAPTEPRPDEDAVRRVLKEALGTDDLASVRRRLAEADVFEEALRAVTAQAEAPPTAPAAPPATPRDDEEELARLARLDPWQALKRVTERQRLEMARMAALAEQRGAWRAKAELTTREFAARLQQEWPEAYDPSHELYRMAAVIYHREMTPAERALPHGFYVAAERAAARLGLPPRSRRATEPSRTTEARAQNVSGRGSRPTPSEEVGSELTAEEKRRLEIMGVSPEVYRKAKAARKAGRNLYVQESSS